MNKQEVIDKLKKLLEMPSEVEGYDFDDGYDFGIEHAISLVEDLDEPVVPQELEKPVVPQFVADWYEEHKDNLEYSIKCLSVHGCLPVRKIDTWFDSEDNKPIETLVMMHKFGYIVKKEKLYTVELPNPNGGGYIKVYLGKYQNGKVGLYEWNGYSFWKQEEKAQLTEAEIKEDFPWLWQFAEKINEDE